MSIWFSPPYERAGRRKYYYDFRDHAGRTHKGRPGFRDKAATEAHIRRQWAEEERLAAGGVPAATQGRRNAPLAELLPVWRAAMAALGRDAKHITRLVRNIELAQEVTRWQTLSAITTESMTAYLSQLHAAGLAACTRNHRRGAVYQLLQFAISQGWLADNPLRHHKPAKVVKVYNRRAFTKDEFLRLCETPKRGWLYTVVGLSGWRRSETGKLQRQDLILDPINPRWAPRPIVVKGRRHEVVPIHPDIVHGLAKQTLALPSQSSRLFRPPSCQTYHRDLARAGIPLIDDAGRHADFHSLRYTFCSLMSKHLPIQVVKELMRHKDIRMTINIYHDLGLTDFAEQVKALPSILRA